MTETNRRGCSGLINANWFITGTGTSVGKTFVTRGIARYLLRKSIDVAAIKPVETGCNPIAADAEALAKACCKPHLANLQGFYRAEPPLAPYAAELAGAADRLTAKELIEPISSTIRAHESVLVEGAGGLLVPLNERESAADLAREVGMPLLLVTLDRLGTLSHTLTALITAEATGLSIASVVLCSFGEKDESRSHNEEILNRWLSVPIFSFPESEDSDEHLADAVSACGLGAFIDKNAKPKSDSSL